MGKEILKLGSIRKFHLKLESPVGVVIGGIGEGKNQRYEVLDIKGVVRLIPVQAENTIPRLKPSLDGGYCIGLGVK